VRLTFDPAKDAWNIQNRGFGFLYAARIFAGLVMENPDTCRDYGEVRMNAVGEIDGRLFAVTYTQRGPDHRHIISARLASRKERRLWLSSAKP
jgi:hypothetical protein